MVNLLSLSLVINSGSNSCLCFCSCQFASFGKPLRLAATGGGGGLFISPSRYSPPSQIGRLSATSGRAFFLLIPAERSSQSSANPSMHNFGNAHISLAPIRLGMTFFL